VVNNLSQVTIKLRYAVSSPGCMTKRYVPMKLAYSHQDSGLRMAWYAAQLITHDEHCMTSGLCLDAEEHQAARRMP